MFLLQIEHSPKDMVPDRAADAKALVVVLIMMKMVVTPERLHPFEGWIPGMNGIMHAAIHQVAQHKPGPESKYIVTHEQVHDAKDGRGDDQAGYRGHKQTLLITGEMVVIAMHDIDELLCSGTLTHPMKGKPVHQVFEEAPEEATRDKGQRDPHHGIPQARSAVIQEIADDGHIDPPDHQGVRLGQHFHILILEQLRLTFIMDFFEFHLLIDFIARQYHIPSIHPSSSKNTKNDDKIRRFRYSITFGLLKAVRPS